MVLNYDAMWNELQSIEQKILSTFQGTSKTVEAEDGTTYKDDTISRDGRTSDKDDDGTSSEDGRTSDKDEKIKHHHDHHKRRDPKCSSTAIGVGVVVAAALGLGLGLGLTGGEDPTTTLAPTTTTLAPTTTTEAPTTAAVTSLAPTEPPKWSGFKITRFDPEHELSVLKDGINGWLTGEYYYYGVPDFLKDMAYLKSVKVIPTGTDITIEYEPKEAVGSIYFITPSGFGAESLNLGWITDRDAVEGYHLQDKYGFTDLGDELIYYRNMKPGVDHSDRYRRVWKKDFDGSGKLGFLPLTDHGFSVTIAFEINKLCPTCAEI